MFHCDCFLSISLAYSILSFYSSSMWLWAALPCGAVCRCGPQWNRHPCLPDLMQMSKRRQCRPSGKQLPGDPESLALLAQTIGPCRHQHRCTHIRQLPNSDEVDTPVQHGSIRASSFLLGSGAGGRRSRICCPGRKEKWDGNRRVGDLRVCCQESEIIGGWRTVEQLMIAVER